MKNNLGGFYISLRKQVIDYLRFNSILAAIACLFAGAVQAQESDINSRDLRGKVVYEDDAVVFRQIDEHTWIGNGHLCYNESLYLVEGSERAALIDAGTRILI